MFYFNINLEFDRDFIHNTINETIETRQKGYVCVVDGNVLATANKDSTYRKIINNALVNTCDGSSIALLAGWIHKTKYATFTGPELFAEYTSKRVKQYFLGNTDEILRQLQYKFQSLNYPVELFRFESLPFASVEAFDYESIAAKINEFQPDIIWVSLGAPKQEMFISRLYPFINQGVLIAIGAAFNFFIADNTNDRAPSYVRKWHLEWLYRVGKEPKRVGIRALKYLILLPKLIIEEIKNKTK
ncbi:MAG: WecB/TagA/CpsF family glycosyltransferase [Dysgonamonadaceae bacterium]|jgi:N-acetylglucosaminyldiphosphoundecaprenol N-acetyl-beta-D-mannosaminyltransferase|nr:WecB/TagA/CpsF family glycosyltransferase [Dysgonamonadaceae bacterium]